MEGKTLEMFYTQLVLLPRVMRYAQYVLLAVGCVLLLIPIVYHMRSQVGGGLGRAAHCLPAGGRGRGLGWGALAVPLCRGLPQPGPASGSPGRARSLLSLTSCISASLPVPGGCRRVLGYETWYLVCPSG